MILTCPDCATRYFVGEDAVPPGGRTVRCAACAAEWRALPEAEAPLTLAPAPPPSPTDPTEPARARPVSAVIRDKAKAQRLTREAAAAGVVWAGLGAGLAVLVGLAVLFRVDVVRMWPRTAGAYAALKLPVNPTGLSPEGVQGGPGLQNGRAVMVVTGALRNVTAGSRPALPLRVALFDRGGRTLATQVVRPAGGPIRPGESRPFAATFADPPIAASAFGVDFAFDVASAQPPRAHAPAHAPPASHHTGAAPPPPPPLSHVPEARALPADSPYALPPRG